MTSTTIDRNLDFELNQRIRIISNDGFYEVNIVQGENDWDLVAVEHSASEAEYVVRAIKRLVKSLAERNK